MTDALYNAHRSEQFTEHSFIRLGTGASAPTTIASGATLGYSMAVNDVLYAEHPFHRQLDRNRDVTVAVSWAPGGSQAGRTLTWRLNVVPIIFGTTNLTGNLGTAFDQVDVAVPDTVGFYTATLFTIPASLLTGANEFHYRVIRLASTADPAADPAIHHVSTTEWRI